MMIVQLLEGLWWIWGLKTDDDTSDELGSSVTEVGWNAKTGNFGARDLMSTLYMMNLWLILALTVKSKLGYNKAGTTAKKFLLEEAGIYFPPQKICFCFYPYIWNCISVCFSFF